MSNCQVPYCQNKAEGSGYFLKGAQAIVPEINQAFEVNFTCYLPICTLHVYVLPSSRIHTYGNPN